MADSSNPILDALAEAFPDEVLAREASCGEDIVTVRPERLAEIFHFLREVERMDYLADITAVDCLELERSWDFEVVYQLASIARGGRRARLKVGLRGRGAPSLPTATGHWKAAGWPEREVMEMFGIVFEGHPDPRKLLLPDQFESHPLRKDYPLTGLGERGDFPVIERAFEAPPKES